MFSAENLCMRTFARTPAQTLEGYCTIVQPSLPPAGTAHCAEQRTISFSSRVFWKKSSMQKTQKTRKENDEGRSAQCAVPAGGKEGCTTVLNPPGFGRGVHANDLLQTLLQKIFMRRSSFKEFFHRVAQRFHTPVTLRVRRI